MATYGGQNVGAGRVDRVKKGLFSCSLLGVGYAVFALGFVALLGGKAAMLFIKKYPQAPTPQGLQSTPQYTPKPAQDKAQQKLLQLCFASPAAWVLADIFLIPAFYGCFGKIRRKIKPEIQYGINGEGILLSAKNPCPVSETALYLQTPTEHKTTHLSLKTVLQAPVSPRDFRCQP